MEVKVSDGAGEGQGILEASVGRGRHQRGPLLAHVLVIPDHSTSRTSTASSHGLIYKSDHSRAAIGDYGLAGRIHGEDSRAPGLIVSGGIVHHEQGRLGGVSLSTAVFAHA